MIDVLRPIAPLLEGWGLSSFLAGFWTLWLAIGVPLAVRRWRFWKPATGVGFGFKLGRAADAVFLWPGAVWGRVL